MAERFALWTELAAQSHVRNWLRSEWAEDFQARLRVLDLGDVRVSTLTYPSVEILRTPKLIRQDDPEVYQVNVLMSGSGHAAQNGRMATVRAGELVLVDSSRPFEGGFDGELSSMTVVQLPRTRLPLPQGVVQQVTATPIAADRGMGGVFGRWLADLDARADECAPADIPALASVTVDLLAAVLGRRMAIENEMTPESRRHALRMEVCDFINRHLGDPPSHPRRSPPRTGYPCATSTRSSTRGAPRSPRGSGPGGWSAAAGTWPTRPCAAARCTRSAPAGVSSSRPTSAAPSARPTGSARVTTVRQPGTADRLLRAGVVVEEAVLVGPAGVPREGPAVAHGVLLALVVEIATARGALDGERADLAVRQGAPGFVDDRGEIAGDGPADRAGTGPGLLTAHRDEDVEQFGGAEPVDHAVAGPLLPSAARLGRQRLPGRDAPRSEARSYGVGSAQIAW